MPLGLSHDPSYQGNSRSLTFRDLIKSVKDLSANLVLDLGCGQGNTLALLSEAGLSCVGIDISGKLVKRASAYAQTSLASGEALPFKDNSFDLIMLKEVLHHIKNPSAVLREANRCLRVPGYIWVLEPVEDDPLLRIGRNLYPFWQGVKVESRLYRAQLERLIVDSRFEIIQTGGIRGVFPHILYFWMGEAIRQSLDFMKIPWRRNSFLHRHLEGRVTIEYRGPALYYWCLAKKKESR